MPKKVTIYTDGSCLSNPGGPGGWAALLRLDGTHHEKLISGGLARTTNNRMEIMAVLMALRALNQPCEVLLVTDSQYVANSITKGWLTSWAKSNFRDKKGKPRLNEDLWRQMLTELQRHTVKVRWIEGHAGHPENELCDKTAREAASAGSLAPDTGYAAQKSSGRTHMPASLVPGM